MAVTALRRLAAAAPAPVFAAVGAGAGVRAAVEDLALHPLLSLVESPRHASLLLVAGRVRAADHADLHRLHDQLPHPRGTVWWRASPDKAFPRKRLLEADDDAAEVLSTAWQELLAGRRDSEPDLLPDEPPAPWRGCGDHGQGGEGMMGGKPYGRPMPMTGEDERDGLALDVYRARFGPFLPMLPPGLQLELALQGDVIQSAQVCRPPYAQGAGTPLRCIARLLRLLGLAALGQRCLREAARDDPCTPRLRRLIERSGAWRAIPAGLGRVSGGSDARTRFREWLDAAASGEPVAPDRIEARLVDLLPGLEWCEAMLVVNSFDSAKLADLCTQEDGGADDEEASS